MMWLRWGIPLIVLGSLACIWLGWTVMTWLDRRAEEEYDERESDT